jgi:hypothetical protein
LSIWNESPPHVGCCVTVGDVTLLPTTTNFNSPQRGERLAAGQRLGEFLCSLCFELVAIEAAVAKQRGAQADIQVLSRAPCDMARCHTCSQIWPTHLSEDTLLCLRPSHSAVMPSVVNVPTLLRSIPQRWLSSKLPGTNNERFQECDRASMSHRPLLRTCMPV